MEEILRNLVNELNDRLKTDTKLQESLKDKKRTVQIELTDKESYNFLFEDCEVKNFNVGTVDKPDIKIITDSETLTGILNQEINPMKAYVSKKLKVKASLMDLLTVKSLLSS
jgi:putative sterol carrier protein